MRRIKRFGIELEGGAYYRGSRERVDLAERLNLGPHNGFRLIIPGAAEIGTDNGYHEIEFSLFPSTSLEEAADKFSECLKVVPSDVEIYWTGDDPFVRTGIFSPASWTPKPRYDSIRKVIAKENGTPDAWACPEMDWMSRYWAYQLHVEIDPESQEGVTLLNWLNNWGPHIARSAADAFGQPGDRITRAWVGWGDPQRLPHYFWFESATELRDAWRRVPRVARKNTCGLWVPDSRKSLPRLGDALHEGFVWWGARPRWSLGTIEFRWCDSLSPVAALILTQWLLEFSEKIIAGWFVETFK